MPNLTYVLLIPTNSNRILNYSVILWRSRIYSIYVQSSILAGVNATIWSTVDWCAPSKNQTHQRWSSNFVC